MTFHDQGAPCNNLPRVALNSGAARIRTCELLTASPAPYCYATKPHITKDDRKFLPSFLIAQPSVLNRHIMDDVAAVVERRHRRLRGFRQRLVATDFVDHQQIVQNVLLIYAVCKLQWTRC